MDCLPHCQEWREPLAQLCSNSSNSNENRRTGTFPKRESSRMTPMLNVKNLTRRPSFKRDYVDCSPQNVGNARKKQTSTVELVKLKKELIVLNEAYYKKTNLYSDYSEKARCVSKEILIDQQNLLSYKNTLKMFESQSVVISESIKVAEPHELKYLQENFILLKNHHGDLKASYRDLEDKVKHKQLYHTIAQNNINSLEVEIVDLMQKIDQIKDKLISYGEALGSIQSLMGEVSSEKIPDDCPHRNEMTWLVWNCSRDNAEEILYGRRSGTFLIRPSSCGQYACSIVSSGLVHHFKIIKTNNGYGFTKPFDGYKSLKELVLHYYYNSLGELNDTLQVTLAYPAFEQPIVTDPLETIDI